MTSIWESDLRAVTAEVIHVAESLARWQFPEPPKLTDDERATVHARIVELGDERQVRRDGHADRLASSARYLGREVRAHNVTLADAETRLELRAREHDPETAVPVLLVDYQTVVEIIRDSFGEL